MNCDQSCGVISSFFLQLLSLNWTLIYFIIIIFFCKNLNNSFSVSPKALFLFISEHINVSMQRVILQNIESKEMNAKACHIFQILLVIKGKIPEHVFIYTLQVCTILCCPIALSHKIPTKCTELSGWKVIKCSKNLNGTNTLARHFVHRYIHSNTNDTPQTVQHVNQKY